MESLKFLVHFEHCGEPITKSNAHMVTGKGNRRWMFVPKKYKDYEKLLRETAQNIMKSSGLQPTDGLVKMTVDYYYESLRRKDLQNSVKTTADALNGIVYKDDSQIHELEIRRHLDRKNPRIIITVTEVSDPSWSKR